MPKKYEISTEAQVLLKLLRIALGTEPTAEDGKRSELFPENIDWREVIRLSYEQKVPALAVDGLKASGYDPREGKSGWQLEELNAVLTPWLDDVKNTEESYSYYHTVLSTICQIFSINGLKPIILKGYGLSKNYYIASHRNSGDIDLFLVDENGDQASERGDEIMEKQLGLQLLNPEEKDVHHSIFVFKGVHIENHNKLAVAEYVPHNEELFSQAIFSLLRPQKDNEEPFIYYPSSTFNVIYLLHHLYAHFYTQKVHFKLFTDMVTFLEHHSSKIEWKIIRDICEKSGLFHFSKGINGILKMYFGLESVMPIGIDETLANRLMHDVFNYGAHGRRGIRNLNIFFKDRWHYKYFGNRNWFSLTIKHILKKIFG